MFVNKLQQYWRLRILRKLPLTGLDGVVPKPGLLVRIARQLHPYGRLAGSTGSSSRYYFSSGHRTEHSPDALVGLGPVGDHPRVA